MSERRRPQGQSPSTTIVVEYRCVVPKEAIQALKQLTTELAAIVGKDSTAYLDRLVVVAPGDVATVKFDAAGQVQRKAGALRPEETRAVAHDIKNDTGLHCFIVLDALLVRPLTLRMFHLVETVSLLLEELLHTELNVIRWRQGAHPGEAEPGCTERLLRCAAILHDEYAVARRKATILSTTPLIAATAGGLMTANPQYTLPLALTLDRGRGYIDNILRSARSGVLPHGQAWEGLVSTFREFVFDPLARDAGYRAGTPVGVVLQDNSPAASQFYQDRIAGAYWPTMLTLFERSWDDNFAELHAIASEVADILASAIRDMGVVFEKRDGGAWWVQF